MSKPKSAYSIPGKKQKSDTHVIVVWVDNEAGVLARVVGLFSGRGYNIESLAVAEVDSKLNISRITIVILDIFLLASTSATAKDSILYPLPEKSPTTLAKTPASLSTQTTIICVSDFSFFVETLYADFGFAISKLKLCLCL